MVVHTFDSTAQAHLCEVEVSLVSIASSRATQQDSVSKASKWGMGRGKVSGIELNYYRVCLASRKPWAP